MTFTARPKRCDVQSDQKSYRTGSLTNFVTIFFFAIAALVWETTVWVPDVAASEALRWLFRCDCRCPVVRKHKWHSGHLNGLTPGIRLKQYITSPFWKIILITRSSNLCESACESSKCSDMKRDHYRARKRRPYYRVDGSSCEPSALISAKSSCHTYYR